MRLIDADELIEHAWRDKLDSRELIAEMINNAPTVKEIPTKIPIDIFEKLVSQEPKKGRWKKNKNYDAGEGFYICSNCKADWYDVGEFSYCPACGAKMH